MGEDAEPVVDVERQLAALIEAARSAARPQARCVRSSAGVRLEICGTLPSSWLGNLSLHCFGVGLDIESGIGCKVSASRWAARFEIGSSRAYDVGAFDFLRMARREPSGATRAATPRLDRFSLTRHPGGGVAAAVSGLDQSGFLAGVLQRFALFGLHPERFMLASRAGRAVDAFVLRSVGGRDSVPEVIARLRTVLAACVVGTSPRT